MRNVLASAGIAALCCGLTGFPASTAAASTAAPRIDANSGGVSHPSAAFPWPATVDLVITVEQTTASPVYRWTLTCDPAGGTLPDPVRACGRLRHVQLPPAMPPVHIMCPLIVYGPQFVTVEGWWHGRWIWLRLDRTDIGCAAASWNGLLFALGLSGPVAAGGPVTG